MPWWAWMAIGGVLLATELVIQTDFWLVVLGAAALVVSGLVWLGLGGPPWWQWLGFAALSVVLAVFVRRRLRATFAGTAPGVPPEFLGESATVKESIEPGGIGAIELRGSTWQARNVGEVPLRAGARVRVQRVEGLVLDVRG